MQAKTYEGSVRNLGDSKGLGSCGITYQYIEMADGTMITRVSMADGLCDKLMQAHRTRESVELHILELEETAFFGTVALVAVKLGDGQTFAQGISVPPYLQRWWSSPVGSFLVFIFGVLTIWVGGLGYRICGFVWKDRKIMNSIRRTGEYAKALPDAILL